MDNSAYMGVHQIALLLKAVQFFFLIFSNLSYLTDELLMDVEFHILE